MCLHLKDYRESAHLYNDVAAGRTLLWDVLQSHSLGVTKTRGGEATEAASSCSSLTGGRGEPIANIAHAPQMARPFSKKEQQANVRSRQSKQYFTQVRSSVVLRYTTRIRREGTTYLHCYYGYHWSSFISAAS